MPNQKTVITEIKNRLLAALPPKVHERLDPYLETCTMEQGHRLHEPGRAVTYVYFPKSAVVALLVILKDGTPLQVSTVGCEGMVGVPLLLGDDQAQARAVVQIGGESVRIKGTVLQRELRGNGRLREFLHRYVNAVLRQLMQIVICRSRHTVAQQCARYLRQTYDQGGESKTFYLTQQLLAMMMGVRQASISEAASRLQKAGMIRYRRGQVTILDRLGLEAMTCECYQIMRQEYDRLLNRKRT